MFKSVQDSTPLLLQSIVLVEIQDTLRQPPGEVEAVKKAIRWGVITTVSFHSYSYAQFVASFDFYCLDLLPLMNISLKSAS